MMKVTDLHVSWVPCFFFFWLSLAACSLLMSCSWYLTILCVKENAPAGLPDKKKGKFTWFNHTTEPHGNIPMYLSILMCMCMFLCSNRVVHWCMSVFLSLAFAALCTCDWGAGSHCLADLSELCLQSCIPCSKVNCVSRVLHLKTGDYFPS